MKSTERRVLAGGVLLLVLLLINAWLDLRAINVIQRNNESVSRTQSMLLSLETTLSLAKDAETGTRGFIITGDESYLQPYRTAVATLPGELKELSEYTAENPKQAELTKQLKNGINRKLSVLKTGIELRRRGGLEAVIANVKKGNNRGKQEMDSLRFLVQQMGDPERDLLLVRLAESDRQIQQSRVTFVMASLAACSLLVLSVWSLTMELSTRRRAEAEIQQQRETLHVTLNSIGDAVIATDRDGNVTFMNPVAEMMTGWPEDEACGAPLDRVFRIEQAGTRTPVDNPALRAMREGLIVGLANHTVLVDRQGREHHIDDSGAPIRGANGDITGAVLVFHDVTSRREIEEQRDRLLVEEQKARTDAEAANLAKDQFIAVLSHELRTPIQPILGWVHLLSEEDLSVEARKVALETIERNVRLQARLIEDILDLSRIATGKIQVTHGIVDPAKVVRESVQGQLPTAQAKSISVVMDLEETPLEISGDPDRLHQVVWNLLGNAIKFTPKGGCIHVRLRRKDSNVEIEVQDDGPGIAPDFLPYVFERFRQSDSSSTRTHGGLGIGLTIARQIVELHGGTIQAESDGEGHGSTFRVRLPIRPFRGETEPADEPSLSRNGGPAPMSSLPLPLAGLEIVVVEDEPDSLRLVLTVLRRNGAKARGCASAQEGRDALNQSVPDIVVSDIGMPGEDGYQFIEAVRRRPRERGGEVPAIALTAFTGIEDQRRALEAGFDRHLAKPIEPWDLVEAIVEVVSGRTGR